MTPVSSVTNGSTRGSKPIQEVVFALDPEEITALSEALAINAEVMCAARSGHPDDAKVHTVTPDLPPQSLMIVETIQGGRRHLTTFPAAPEKRSESSQSVVPASATTAPKAP